MVGYYKPLCSWRSFHQRISKVDRVNELGYIRHKVFYNHMKYPVKFMVSQQAEKEELVKTLEDWLPVWVTLHSGKFNTILQGKFRVNKARVLRAAERPRQKVAGQNVRISPPRLRNERKRLRRGSPRIKQILPGNEFEGYHKFFASAMANQSP